MCRQPRTPLTTPSNLPLPPSSTPSSSGPTIPQLIPLLQSLSRSDWRQLKTEIKAEKRAVKAQLHAYKHELKSDPESLETFRKMNRHERKAAKHAVAAQLWGDALGRTVERIAARQTGQQAGTMREEQSGVEYQTLRDEGEKGTVGRPPVYVETVEKDEKY